MDDEARTVKLTEIKARIARADYAVDHDAVASAFVERMLAVHGALRGADVRALLSGEALEAIRLSA